MAGARGWGFLLWLVCLGRIVVIINDNFCLTTTVFTRRSNPDPTKPLEIVGATCPTSIAKGKPCFRPVRRDGLAIRPKKAESSARDSASGVACCIKRWVQFTKLNQRREIYFNKLHSIAKNHLFALVQFLCSWLH